jgi:hypothetical protein
VILFVFVSNEVGDTIFEIQDPITIGVFNATIQMTTMMFLTFHPSKASRFSTSRN